VRRIPRRAEARPNGRGRRRTRARGAEQQRREGTEQRRSSHLRPARCAIDHAAQRTASTPADRPIGAMRQHDGVPSDRRSVHTAELSCAAALDVAAALAFLGRRAVRGVETREAGCYTRTVRAPGGPARICLSRGEQGVDARVELTDPTDLATVLALARRLLDLDADQPAIDARLAADPALAVLLAARPGLPSPGAADGFEMAIRAVVGQQISVSGAHTILGRIAAEHGSRAFGGEPAHLFPGPADLAGADPASLPMPRSRARTVLAIAEACASGDLCLDPDADRGREHAALLALPGVGPWTADYIRMRALGDRDVLLATDLGVRRSAARLGIDLTGGRPEWAPWRSYATHHLWAGAH
jgi:AraC family transcriptional regulator of adaptative response / DNA-3-methyladenine glycosylase II